MSNFTPVASSIGGALLGLGYPPPLTMLFACGPGLVTAGLVTLLGRHRRGRGPAVAVAATAAAGTFMS